ncbi:unnamed protein product [Prorocentrum cordatum]|uniref:Ubiquitin-like protease family profile domain-containing protein n=1 Tax=Prorocentrum cordatum TaxID=2364126 RepID=A0ABN9PNB7_9DINO|nr:unnamed protein product [Polarella glacialis]
MAFGAASGDEGWENVKGWTKRVALFSYRYLLLPVNSVTVSSVRHWWLAVVKLRGPSGRMAPSVVWLDSNQGPADLYAVVLRYPGGYPSYANYRPTEDPKADQAVAQMRYQRKRGERGERDRARCPNTDGYTQGRLGLRALERRGDAPVRAPHRHDPLVRRQRHVQRARVSASAGGPMRPPLANARGTSSGCGSWVRFVCSSARASPPFRESRGPGDRAPAAGWLSVTFACLVRPPRQRDAQDWRIFVYSWRPIVVLAVALPNFFLLAFFSDVAIVPGAGSYGTKLIDALADVSIPNVGLLLVAAAFFLTAVLYVLGWATWSDSYSASESDGDSEVEQDGHEDAHERSRRITRMSMSQFVTGFIAWTFFVVGCIMHALKWPFWSRMSIACLTLVLLWVMNSWRQSLRVRGKFQSVVRGQDFMTWCFACLFVTSVILAGLSMVHLHRHPDYLSWESYRNVNIVKSCGNVDERHCLYDKVLQQLAKNIKKLRGRDLTLKDCKQPSESEIVIEKPEAFSEVKTVCQLSETVFFTLFLTQFIYFAACLVTLVAWCCECYFRHSVSQSKSVPQNVEGAPNPYRIKKVLVMLMTLSFCLVFFVGLFAAVSGANVNVLNGMFSVGFAVFALSLAWAAWNASRIYEVLHANMDLTTTDAEKSQQFQWLQSGADDLKGLLDNEWVQALMFMSGVVPLFYMLEKTRLSVAHRCMQDKRRGSHTFDRVSNLFMSMLEGSSNEQSSPSDVSSTASRQGDAAGDPLRPLFSDGSSASSCPSVTHYAMPPINFKGWNVCSVLIKVCLLSEVYFSIQVGSKATFVFLSYMIEVLAPMELVFIMVMSCVVGFAMFMLPVVPGMAVYLFIGILIPKAVVDREEPEKQHDFAVFVRGVAIAVFLALILKLVACVGQYFIGYFLGQDIHIQKEFNVDQKPMRAAASVLTGRSDPCRPIGKIIVLVGGPDWPVSVVCGILKIDILDMLLYTIPVAVVQLPCIMSGAYMIKAKPNEQTDDSMWRNVWSLIAAAGQGMCALGAIYVGQLAYTQDPNLLKEPEDPDELETYRAVQELREMEKQDLAIWEKTLRDTRLLKGGCQPGAGWVIFFAACLSVASNAVLLGDGLAFENFELSSKISDDIDDYGLGGDPFNLVKPVGWIVLGAFAVSVTMHVLFVKAKAREAARERHDI